MLAIPPALCETLYALAIDLVHERGVTAADFSPAVAKTLPAPALAEVASFGLSLRTMLLRHTGAVLLTGLDLAQLGRETEPLYEPTAKMVYYLLMAAVGEVDEGTRGRLFDVKASGLSHEQDNVLFSVTDGEATWHTDGTSVDAVKDVVGLLCIRPAAEGGRFGVANACNVHAELCALLPPFLLAELTRALPREVMERGKGQGSADKDWVTALSRSGAMLASRSLRNAFPIYEVVHEPQAAGGPRLRFRYMRFWIENALKKCGSTAG